MPYGSSQGLLRAAVRYEHPATRTRPRRLAGPRRPARHPTAPPRGPAPDAVGAPRGRAGRSAVTMGGMHGELFPRERTEIAPGAVHVPDWLGPDRQRELLADCREWARPPAGLRTVHTPGGGTMTARQVCLGLHWYPYGYARTAVDGDGAPVKPMPARLAALGRAAVAAAYGEAAAHGQADGERPAGQRAAPTPRTVVRATRSTTSR